MMDNDKKLSNEEILTADFEALDRAIRIVSQSAFTGAASVKVANTLEVLEYLKQGVLDGLRSIAADTTEASNEKE